MINNSCAITQKDVTYTQGNVTLGGTVFIPEMAQPCPAIVFVHGSGGETRDAWRKRAEAIAQQGIAALIYDKRGTGVSTGNWQEGSYRELAEDALAGVRFLKEHYPALDAEHIGLCGCSEGGWVVPLAATFSPEIGFIVTVSAAAMTPTTQEYYRRELLIREKHSTPVIVALRMFGVKLMFNSLRILPKTYPGFLGFSRRTLFFHPLPTWRSLKQPVLALWGEKDESVPPQQSATIIKQVLQEAGHTDYTLHLFPEGDHGIGRFVEAADGQQQWEPVPGFIETIVEWVWKQAPEISPV